MLFSSITASGRYGQGVVAVEQLRALTGHGCLSFCLSPDSGGGNGDEFPLQYSGPRLAALASRSVFLSMNCCHNLIMQEVE